MAENFAKALELEEFLNEELGRANYSHIEIKKTPISTRIIIYAERPGMVIGKSGQKINELTKKLKDLGADNPIIEVEEVKNIYSDARIVAKNIARMIERGINYKRATNLYLERMKEQGIVGAEIAISGKLSGERSRTEKFGFGYIKKCGELSKQLKRAREIAITKPGVIGVKVTIMESLPNVLKFEKIKHFEERKETGFEIEKQKKLEILDKKLDDVVKFIKNMEDEAIKKGMEDKFSSMVEDMIEMEKAGKNRKSLLEYLERAKNSVSKNEKKV